MSTETATQNLPQALQQDTIEAQIVKREIWERVWRKDKHFMAVIVGREGDAKSSTAIKLAESVDPTFEASRVMYDPASFLKRLQRWKANDETQGKAVVIDEAGVGLGVRTWYDKDQVLLNKVLQIIRSENMVVFFTLPRLSELDSQTEGRLHAFIEMVDMLKDVWAEFKWFEWDPTRDGRNKAYREYPTVEINGFEHQVKRMRVSPPSDDIVEAYERDKKEFQDKQYQQAIEELEDDIDDETSVKDIAMGIADGEIADYVDAHSQNGTPVIKETLIRADYEVSHNDAKAVKDLLKRQFSQSQLEEYV